MEQGYGLCRHAGKLHFGILVWQLVRIDGKGYSLLSMRIAIVQIKRFLVGKKKILSVCWLVSWSAPDIIAAEIMENLQMALEQFSEIGADLSSENKAVAND